MKQLWGIVGVVAGVMVLIAVMVAGSYNGLVSADETVNQAWGNVQSAYQRRADLIPNVVATVSASAEFEQQTLVKVTQFRAGIANAQTPQDLELVGQEMTAAINVVFEAYPNIQTTDAYRDLIIELEGSENRIKRERDVYNEAVKSYNTKVRKFPTTIIAGMFGFDQHLYFQASDGSENAPDVGALFDT